MDVLFPLPVRAFPTSHDVAVALDDYLAITKTSRTAFFQSASLEQAFAVEQPSFDLATGQYPRAAQAIIALARLRFEAAVEIERLIALLDAIDGDPDLELCSEDEGAQCDDEGVEDDREPDAPENDHRCASERERVRLRRSAAQRLSDNLAIPILRRASL